MPPTPSISSSASGTTTWCPHWRLTDPPSREHALACDRRARPTNPTGRRSQSGACSCAPVCDFMDRARVRFVHAAVTRSCLSLLPMAPGSSNLLPKSIQNHLKEPSSEHRAVNGPPGEFRPPSRAVHRPACALPRSRTADARRGRRRFEGASIASACFGRGKPHAATTTTSPAIQRAHCMP